MQKQPPPTLEYSTPDRERASVDPYHAILRFCILVLAIPLFLIGVFAVMGGVVHFIDEPTMSEKSKGGVPFLLGLLCLYLTHRLGKPKR